MAFRAYIQRAEDVAAGFTTFRAPLPEHAAEVTSLIADLYSISAALSSLDDLDRDPRYRHNVGEIQPELNIVRASLNYTLEDIVDLFRALDGGEASATGYKSTWMTLTQFFREESGYSLATRLAQYKTMLREIIDSTKNNRYDSPLFAGYLKTIKTLLSVQDSRLASRMERMSLGRNPSSSSNSAGASSPASDRRPRRRRSYERVRPTHTSPAAPVSPASVTFSDHPPSIPEERSPPAATSRSDVSDAFPTHWANHIFRSATTSTPLPAVDEMSDSYVKSQPGIKKWLRENGFEPLLHIGLNDQSHMRVSFWLRKTDYRARILCWIPYKSGPSDSWCEPLNSIMIVRSGSCLQLRRRHRDELIPWIQLKFTRMEDLIVFHNTFLALRSQDAGHPYKKILDYELDGELELFGGLITDDGYLHALRVYEDIETGAVRLQASVHEGEMKRTPVWTAFVTTQIEDPEWLTRERSKKIFLKDTKPVIFISKDQFRSPQTVDGFLTLRFTTSSDARQFVGVMDELAGHGPSVR